MRKAIRQVAVATAVAVALSLAAAPPAAAWHWGKETPGTRISQRIQNRGLLAFLWTTITGIWDEEGTTIPPGG